MSSAPVESWTQDLRTRLDDLLDHYRDVLRASVDNLTEDEARKRLVPSKTTLLGLLKHVTYVEGVWFEQAVSGRTAKEVGIATSPDRSFTLSNSDDITSILATHQRRCEKSRATLSSLALDDSVNGRGEHSVWALYLQVLRELAHHAGHADILREQVLAARDANEHPAKATP